mgnify:CR=1 FL=1
MGLDGVELVMAWEEEFDIQISDADAEKLTTVGRAIDFIYHEIGGRPPTDPEAFAAKRISKQLAEVLGKPLDDFNRKTPILGLLDENSRPQQWKRLGLLPPYRAEWLRVVTHLASWLVAYFLTANVPSFGGRIEPFWFFIPILLGSYWLCFWFTRLWLIYPNAELTIDGWIAKEAERFAWKEVKLSRQDVSDRVRNIIVEQLGVRHEQTREDAEFIRDLGVD